MIKHTHTLTPILYTCSCFTHSAPPEPGMTAVLCLVRFQISSIFRSGPSLSSLPAVVYCGILESWSCMVLYFCCDQCQKFQLVPDLICPGGVLVFLEPRSSQQRVSVFCFSSVALNHHVCGSCALPVYQWRYKYGRLLPCLICNPVVRAHTHIPSTYLGENPRTDIAWYFLLPPLLSSRCWHKCLACHGEHFPAYCETFIGQNEFCITPIFQRIIWISLIFCKTQCGLSSFDSLSWWLRGAAGVTQLLQTPGWIPSLTHTHNVETHVHTHSEWTHCGVLMKLLLLKSSFNK